MFSEVRVLTLPLQVVVLLDPRNGRIKDAFFAFPPFEYVWAIGRSSAKWPGDDVQPDLLPCLHEDRLYRLLVERQSINDGHKGR